MRPVHLRGQSRRGPGIVAYLVTAVFGVVSGVYIWKPFFLPKVKQIEDKTETEKVKPKEVEVKK